MQGIRISIYLIVFIMANFIVLYFGNKGLIITALLLIPFDFVMRCLFHEQWKGIELIKKLGSIVLLSSFITYIINVKTINIALGSSIGFISAQIVAGIFYQIFINKPFIFKVNGSDAVGILADSFIFQIVAFHYFDLSITISQFILKLLGGLFWYWVIFKKYKLHERWLQQKDTTI